MYKKYFNATDRLIIRILLCLSDRYENQILHEKAFLESPCKRIDPL